MNEKGNSGRKIVYSSLVSLDGFVAGPNGELDWSEPDEEVYWRINDQQHQIDTLLFGRRMYETMVVWDELANNPELSEIERDFVSIWSRQAKIVFSSTLETVQGDARLARNGLGQEIAQLKAAPGKDIEIAGATLASSAFKLDLIDEVWLYVQPIILGNGKPWFPTPGQLLKLDLVNTLQFDSGVVFLHYVRNR
jgi:dihydrofolate reductase